MVKSVLRCVFFFVSCVSLSLGKLPGGCCDECRVAAEATVAALTVVRGHRGNTCEPSAHHSRAGKSRFLKRIPYLICGPEAQAYNTGHWRSGCQSLSLVSSGPRSPAANSTIVAPLRGLPSEKKHRSARYNLLISGRKLSRLVS